jgi:hypothetical protein
MRPIHVHDWIRDATRPGTFLCNCGATGVMTSMGFRESRPPRKKAVR